VDEDEDDFLDLGLGWYIYIIQQGTGGGVLETSGLPRDPESLPGRDCRVSLLRPWRARVLGTGPRSSESSPHQCSEMVAGPSNQLVGPRAIFILLGLLAWSMFK
jgi:hypothetical protein